MLHGVLGLKAYVYESFPVKQSVAINMICES